MDTADGSQIKWYWCLLLVTTSGSVGGLIAAVLKALKHITENLPDYDDLSSVRAHNEMCKRMKLTRFYVGRSIVGIGGAFAAVLAGTWIEKVRYTTDTENILALTALCLIAGTIAHNLVPGIGERLQDELIRKQVRNIGAVANEKAAQAEEKIEINRDYAVKVSHADTALSTKSPSDINLAIKELEQLSKTNPTDRTVYIYLGRMFRLKEQYDRAIETLREFVGNVEEELIRHPDKTHQFQTSKGAAFYNMACYHALKAKNYKASGVHNAAEVGRLKEETKELLKMSIQFDGESLVIAKEDDDFSGILSTEEIMKLA